MTEKEKEVVKAIARLVLLFGTIIGLNPLITDSTSNLILELMNDLQEKIKNF